MRRAERAEIRRAVEREVQALMGRSMFLSDDTVATVMSWYDAHRYHADEPYISCPFCQDKFVLASEAAKPQITDEAVERLAVFLQVDWAGPYHARVRDFMPTDSPMSPGPKRDAAIRALAAADREAEAQARKMARYGLEYALGLREDRSGYESTE